MKEQLFSQQITFLHTSDLEMTRRFYSNRIGLPLVRDQKTCMIFRTAENAFLGFCSHIEPISAGRKVILTLVCEDVDAWYEKLTSKGITTLNPPKTNPTYQIYHFFFLDPNGYWIEIQRFDQPL